MLGAAAAAFGCLAISGTANAAKIGPADMTPSGGGGAGVCVNDACTMADVQLPEAVGQERAPFTGTLTTWQVSIAAPHDLFDNNGQIALQVLKRTDNKPGNTGDEYAAVRQSEYEDVTPNAVNSFNADLRIRKGQFIGIAVADTFTEVRDADRNQAIRLQFEPPLIPGEPGTGEDFMTKDSYRLFNAKLVRG